VKKNLEHKRDFGNYIEKTFSNYNRQSEKTIIVDGCSMVGYFEGSAKKRDEFDKHDKIHRDMVNGDDLGANLSERFGFNHVGLNFVAKSNCSIFRDTTNFLLYNYKNLTSVKSVTQKKNFKKSLSNENLFLIVQWTGLGRYSYFDRDNMGWDTYHMIVTDTESGKRELHPGKNLDYHSIIDEYMNRFLYQISIANLCENLGVNYIMYNGCDDMFSYRDIWITNFPPYLKAKIKKYTGKNSNSVYDDFDSLSKILLTKNFLDIPCTGYFGYETGRYKKDKKRIKKYTIDGLHMNKLGYQEWVKILEDFIIEKGMGDFINER
jgi:hypothetical protein